MQPGFFDLDNRLQQLEALGDPLPKLSQVVDWESFRPVLLKIRQKPRKNRSGRKPYDVVLMFKVLVLQHLYNLADDQTEYQIRDRYSFSRFLGISPEGKVPDAKTIWLFREALKEYDLVDELFAELNAQIKLAGYIPRQGQIVDASMVAAPRQRNTWDENTKIKQGEMPEDWEDNPSMLRQKDLDARWTKKHGKTHYGYKSHISIDRKHKLICHFEVTSASVADNQVFDVLLPGQQQCRCLGGCRLSVKGTRTIAQRREPYPYERASQQAALSLSATSQPETVEAALSCRTCLCSTAGDGWQTDQNHRLGTSAGEGCAHEYRVQPQTLVLVGG